MRPIVRILRAAIAGMLLGLTMVPGAAHAWQPAPETLAERWALEGADVRALALLPDGDVLAGTRKGLWRVEAETKSASPYPSAGLPEGCGNPVEFDDCLVTAVEVSASGDAYALVGTRALAAETGGYLPGNAGLYRNRAGAASWERLISREEAAAQNSGQSVPASYLGGFALGADGALYVIANGQHAYAPEDRDCVYRSGDGGATWRLTYCGSPDDPSILSVAAGPDGRAWLTTGHMYYFWSIWLMTSADGVAPWEVRKIDPQDDEGHYGYADIAFDREGRVYTTATLANRGGGATRPLGLYRSGDAGATWEQLSPEGLSDQFNAIAFAENGDILFGNGGTVWRTPDDGGTWLPVNPDVEALNAMLVGRDGHLWLGTAAWLYRTSEAVTAGPLTVAPISPGGPGGPAAPTPAAEGTVAGSGDTGIDDARTACAESGGTFTELPNGGYECTHGPGGAPAAATSAPVAQGTVSPPTEATAPPLGPAATATATATAAAAPTQAAATGTMPLPVATATPAPVPGTAPTVPAAATAATGPDGSAAPSGNAREDARRTCFASGGEFWERPNGDFGCRVPGSGSGSAGVGSAPGAGPGAPGAAGAGQQPSGPACAPCPQGTAGGAGVIFSLGSFASRVNGPNAPTQFTLGGRYVIERIQTWHIQGSSMAAGGTIALRGEDGTLYGPWLATAVAGGTVREAAPNVTLGPGVYTIIDSDPDTWSQNADTGGRGMAAVFGKPAGAP